MVGEVGSDHNRGQAYAVRRGGTQPGYHEPMSQRRGGLVSGLLTRLVLAFGAVSLLPLALVSVQLIAVNREAMTTQVLRTHSVAARTTAERVATMVTTLAATLDPLAQHPEVVDAPRSPASQSLLAGAVEGQSLVALVLQAPDGGEVLRVQERDRAEIVAAVLAHQPALEPRIVPVADRPWIGLDRPLADGRGWCRGVADGMELTAVLASSEIGDAAELVLLDDDGTRLWGAARDRFPEQMVTAAITGRLGGAGRYSDRSGEVLGAYAPVQGTPWFVLSRQPLAVAEAVARRMVGRALVATVGAVVLAALLGAGAYRTVVRPLRDLVRAQRRLAGGGSTRGSEISQLQESFARLQQRLEDRDDLGRVFLGRYQVLEVIGQGAMGAVFRGWDPRLERQVALKTVRPDPSLNAEQREEMVEALMHEAVQVARFSHPHIVAVYDVEDAPGVAYLALELVSGPSLLGHLRSVGRLDFAAVATLGVAIAEALSSAHAHGLVHHDIKPGNILLGTDGAIKVADFGISRAISSLAQQRQQVFGTPGYLPPETLKGGGFSEHGDLFALGVVLYQCLVGELPFAGGTMAEVLQATMAGNVTPVAHGRLGVPADLAEVVESLLETDPDRRPGDASELAARLRGLVQQYEWVWQPPVVPSTTEVEMMDGDSHSQLLATRTLREHHRGSQ